MKNTKIKKLVIELSGKDVELTIQQAKELQLALNELFEEKVKVIKEKEYIPRPYPVPSPYVAPFIPYVPARPWKPWRQEPWITWGGCETLYRNTIGTNMELSGDSLRLQLNS
jgi:hypothetical protein